MAERAPGRTPERTPVRILDRTRPAGYRYIHVVRSLEPKVLSVQPEDHAKVGTEDNVSDNIQSNPTGVRGIKRWALNSLI